MASQEELDLANCVTAPRPQKYPTPKAPTKTKKPKEPKKLEGPKKPKEPKKTTIAIKRAGSPAPAKPNRVKKATKEPDRKILVAVDFGTTFSGLAWAQTRNPDAQMAIYQRPDATSDSLEGASCEKAPTEITYDGEDYRWGFQIKDAEQRHQWFKLALDPSQAPSSNLSCSYTDPLAYPPSDDAEKYTSDYMTALREHAERVLRHKLPGSALRSIPVEYIITIPAVWSDRARAKTKKCAEIAGMGAGAALHIISEPEAAATYALTALQPHGLKIGETFMICDAGGGTVDLITYKVSALKPSLELAEASPGSGSACGATFLNRRFRKYLEEKLGDEDVLEEAMRRFESGVKRQFRGKVGEVFQIPVPGLEDNKDLGIRRNKMTMSGADVRDIFEPVVKEVIRLVTEQIKAAKRHVKAVVLVGGFGQSAYLRDAIREEVRSHGAEVLQSPKSWTAVVEGTLMKGLASTSPAFSTVRISGRSARKHCGINCGTQYLEVEHGNARKILDACSGFYRTYMMEWFIKKGDLVKEDSPVRLNYQRQRLVSRGPFTTISTTIYYSSDIQNSGAPRHVEDESVTQLVKVEADLSRIPTDKISKMKGADGKMYYKVDYAIQVTYMSAYTSYELIYGGVNYGHVKSDHV